MTETAKEIVAYCSSCKIDLAMIIVAKTEVKIAKVQCKTCKKEQAYKAAKGITNPSQVPPPKTRKSKKAAEDDAAKIVSIEAEWTKLMNDVEKSPRLKYTPKVALKQGDVVSHPTFGEGIVMRISYPNKAEIIFRTDVKMLIHSRP